MGYNLMSKLKNSIKSLNLKEVPKHVSIIAEYSSTDYTKPASVGQEKTIVKDKYHKSGTVQAPKQKQKTKNIIIGDVVKSGKLGRGRVIPRSKNAKKSGLITVSFNGIVKDIAPQAVILIKRRK